MSAKIVTWEEFEKHIYFYDCWVLVEGNVYNVTDFLVEHPGGDYVLIRESGQDATSKFIGLPHSDYAISLRNARLVGKIESSQPPQGYLERISKKKKQIQKKERKKLVIRSDKIPSSEVALHKSQQSCWIVIHKKVYDVSQYLEDHPGGVGQIMNFAGKDATIAFERQIHSEQANKIKDTYYIGELQTTKPTILILITLLFLVGCFYCVFLR